MKPGFSHLSRLVLGREKEMRKGAISLTNRRSLVDIRGDVTRYSECGKGSGPNMLMRK